ncbi:MAG TPA: hypothetical protein VJM12_06770 [Pyrinomonadaceae bacterium]|nr:hypothetical protein [Pyrinomonadaceae bacterium]
MKRCPKCNRTFPDEAQRFCTVDGGLLITEPTFDPNATVRATSAELRQASQTPPERATQTPPERATYIPPDRATSRELPDMGETVAIQPEASTAVFGRTTGPTGVQTASNLQGAVLQPAPPPPLGATTNPPQPQKKSKLPLIIGALAAVFLLGIVGLVAVFFFVVQPRLAQVQDRPPAVVENPPAVETNPNTAPEETPTPAPAEETEAPFEPSADLVKFENSNENLNGSLAEHYVPFSFYYPKTWQPDSTAGRPGASNFVKVERRLPPDFTQENFAVGWYTSEGTFEADKETFPRLVERVSAGLANSLPEYRKVSEGPTKINSRDAYEFRFVSLSKGTEKGDIELWGRVVFLPPGVQGQTAGATLFMLATSLAPELASVEDVGQKGEMPVILESFRFGRTD